MNRLKLEYLFQKYINSASPAEVDEFLLLIQNFSDEEILALLEKAFNESDVNEKYFSEERSKELLQNILDSEEIVKEESLQKVIPIRKKIQWMKYAAIASLVLIGIIVGILMNNDKKTVTTEIANIDQEIIPGSDKAILELADGTVLDLNNNNKGDIFEKNGLVISKTADGQIVYNASNSSGGKNTSFAYNKITTPKGGQYQVILPDGSKVWLNAASSLKYPEVFTGNERKVELQGEGYFEVASDKTRPFKVVSKGQVVKVLGTHFNINCYDDEPLVKTTLIEGLVEITENSNHSSILLRPREQASLGNSHKFEIAKNNIESAVAWKNGFYRFQGAKIDQVMRELSRWYNVEIEVENKSKELEFWREIYRNSSITDALEILSYFNLNYKVEQSKENKKILIF